MCKEHFVEPDAALAEVEKTQDLARITYTEGLLVRIMNASDTASSKAAKLQPIIMNASWKRIHVQDINKILWQTALKISESASNAAGAAQGKSKKLSNKTGSPSQSATSASAAGDKGAGRGGKGGGSGGVGGGVAVKSEKIAKKVTPVKQESR